MHDPADPAYYLGLRCYAVGELADAAVHSGHGDAVRGIVAGTEELARATPSPALHSDLRYARALLAAAADRLQREDPRSAAAEQALRTRPAAASGEGVSVAATVARAGASEPDTVVKQAAAGSVTGRFTRPQEVADLVLMLASDRTGNVTGTDFVVDGGLITTL